MKHKPVNVIVKLLGQYTVKTKGIKNKYAAGIYYLNGTDKIPPNTILIDPRQNQRAYLDTLIHEMLHKLCTGWTETRVKKCANEITTVIWKQGYRKELNAKK